MADSIREKIVKNLKASLEEINGFGNFTNTFQASAIQRFVETGIITTIVPYIWIVEGDEMPEDGPYPLITETLEIHLIIGWRRESTAETRSGDEVMNSLRGDVYRAVMANPTRIESGNSLAINTRYDGSGPIPALPGQPEIEIGISFKIIYRHILSDPASIV